MIEINQCRYIVRDTPHLSDFRTSPVIYHSPIDATDETACTVVIAFVLCVTEVAAHTVVKASVLYAPQINPCAIVES